MGALFSTPKAPDTPPPPPNPQTTAKAGESYSAVVDKTPSASGTILTSPTGTQETKTASKQLLGQ